MDFHAYPSGTLLPAFSPVLCCWIAPQLPPVSVLAMELGPATAAERKKAIDRASRPTLPIGRPTLEVTGRLRERYC